MVSNNNNVVQPNDAVRRSEPDLDSRYGEIGISAVVAALRYRRETRNAGTHARSLLPRRPRGPELNIQ